MTLQYRALAAHTIGDAIWEAWSRIRANARIFDSPFFCPEFTRIVASVREDVEVAILEQEGQPVGFFPYQRLGRTVQPVVGRLSEFHGAITSDAIEWSAMELFRACDIGSWHFDHLPESQTEFMRYAWGQKSCPFIDLRAGFEAYRVALKQRGSAMSQLERKARKLHREVGPLRFEWHDPAPSVLASLIDWKSDQHRRTKVLEIFKHSWVGNLLEELKSLAPPSVAVPAFAAPLAALYAGDELVAVHLGIRSADVLHMWFPAYNPTYKEHSPGSILLMRIADAAPAHGIGRIDLGPGEERYKQQFKSDDLPISEGMVSQSLLTSKARAMWFHVKRRIRSSRFRSHLETPLRATRRLRQWMAFK